MKVWMWQRLWKCNVRDYVFSAYAYEESDLCLHSEPLQRYTPRFAWHWLCPKPNLVLVDRKHLGGME